MSHKPKPQPFMPVMHKKQAFVEQLKECNVAHTKRKSFATGLKKTSCKLAYDCMTDCNVWTTCTAN